MGKHGISDMGRKSDLSVYKGTDGGCQIIQCCRSNNVSLRPSFDEFLDVAITISYAEYEYFHPRTFGGNSSCKFERCSVASIGIDQRDIRLYLLHLFQCIFMPAN